MCPTWFSPDDREKNSDCLLERIIFICDILLFSPSKNDILLYVVAHVIYYLSVQNNYKKRDIYTDVIQIAKPLNITGDWPFKLKCQG